MVIDKDGNAHSNKTGKFVAKDGSTIEKPRTDREWTKRISPKSALETLKQNIEQGITLSDKAIEYFESLDGGSKDKAIELIKKAKALKEQELDLLTLVK